MSRPLTGSKKQIATGWEASLPEARGAKKRTRHVFTTEAAAGLWLAAAKADLENGRTLTVPIPDDIAETSRRKTSHPNGTAFRPMGEKWTAERYEEMRLAGVGRQVTATGHVRTISDWMEARGLTFETMVRAEVKDFQKSLTRRAEPANHAAVPEGLDPEALVTLREALALPQMTASRSTLKRRIGADELVAAATPATGHLYAIEDLFSEAVMHTAEGGLRRGPRRRESLSQEVVTDIMWVFDEVCKFAKDHGIDVPDDRSSLAVHRTDKAAKPPRQPLGLAQAARIASRLHAVHQIALWIMRVLGLRISEAYGVRVQDVIDNGPGEHGVVYIKAQGGRTFPVRNGSGGIEIVDRVEELKTTNSYRVLVVPAMLMDVVRVVVEVFHTTPDGTVDASASLIPGLSKKNAGGQAAFRAALALAAAAEGIDCTSDEDSLNETFSCQPHDMRRSVLSSLNSSKDVKASHSKRFAGHAAGADVHHRHYALDDPQLKPMLRIAKTIQKTLLAELPEGLMIPTAVRCTTGNQRVLAADAVRIDATLAEGGWLLTAADAESNPLLTAEQAAVELNVTEKTVREWMRAGFLQSVVWADRARGQERRSRLCDVLALQRDLRSLTTIHGLAAEVNKPYHTVYQYIRAQEIKRHQHGERGLVIDESAGTRVRAHYATQAALHERAVPFSVAAADLGVTPDIVAGMADEGLLVVDDRAHDGRRMVTRASLAALGKQRQQQSTRKQRGPRTDLVAWQDARSATGLSDAQMDALVAEGVLIQEQHHRRRHLTRGSVLVYLVAHAPERLAVTGV